MKHFTYANVASTLALFIAVSGGGVAVAAVVANNSVGSPQIINGSIKGADLKTGAMSSPQVKNNSLTGGDIKNGTISGGDVSDGTLTRADLADQKLGMFLAYGQVEASDPFGTPVTLSGYYTYNSGGGTSTSTRTAVGKYTVNFNGLHKPGAVPMVESMWATHQCAPVSWNDVGSLSVECRDNTGAVGNAGFLAGFVY